MGITSGYLETSMNIEGHATKTQLASGSFGSRVVVLVESSSV
jgi:hypothetical protein